MGNEAKMITKREEIEKRRMLAELEGKEINDVEMEKKVNNEVKNNVEEETKGNTETNEIIKRINECVIESSPFRNINKDYYELSKSICKIKIELENEKGIIIKGTGFFLHFVVCGEYFNCLISNEHVIRRDLININTIINILYDNEKRVANIKLNIKERYIKNFKDEYLDITVVEILEKDNIPSNYFLNEGHISNDRLNDSEICVLGYPESGELKMSMGIIKKINNYEFTHLASTKKGSSGSPIFMEKSGLVLGIHKQRNNKGNENYGDFIYPAIKIIKKDLGDKIFIGKYVDGKYIYENHRYYEGEFKNNMPNGKGKLYDKNDKIIYEGDFIEGKYEGNGKLFFKNSSHPGISKNGLYCSYYVGQFKNGSLNGKGKIYDKNDKIIYEGDFNNDNPEGNGQFPFGNNYCIGQFENGNIFHGKVIDSKKKMILEGDFLGKNFNGSLKIIMDDDSYWMFPIINTELSEAEGKMYDKNGDLLGGSWVGIGFVSLLNKMGEDKKCVIY